MSNIVNADDDESEELKFSKFVAEIERIDLSGSSLPEFQALAQQAQLLTAVGKYSESIPIFERAMKDLRTVKDNFIWQGLYSRTGGLFASALDYVGQVERAEQIYQEVIREDPDGFFIGDYAVFLHRRKKDYFLAQKCVL